MLNIKSLVKLYKKNRTNKQDVYALNKVDLSFAKNELVFIVGKSGSGKSTLLNIIGSLDKPTSGEVYFYNKPYSKMKGKDIDALRQNIAFIFQDFALIEEFNVFDNIKMARSDVSDNEVLEALEKVELSGFENRKINTLSAGQKQRVSIARAIVKKPKVILCDEPTGNLDFITSQAILKCLKNISKDVLVLLVSHNLDDAYTYGSRIIELANGILVKDIKIDEAYNKSYVIKDDSLYLTTIKSISNDELSDINKKIESNNIKFLKPKTALFEKYIPLEHEESSIDLKRKKIKFKELFKSSHKLLRKQFVRTVLFSLVTALVLSIFSISYSISNFDEERYITESIEDLTCATIIKSKASALASANTAPLINGYQEMLKGELNKDYFEVYPINVKLSEQNYLVDGGFWQSTFYGLFSPTKNKIYPYSLFGTIKMDKESFSKNVNNGEGFIILEEADEYKEYGLYITDVVADLFKSNNVSYLGYQYSKATNTNNKVKVSYCNGVVKTDFYEKFPDAQKYFNQVMSREDFKVLSKDETVREMLQYLEYTMFYCYTFEDNFIEYFLNSELCRFRLSSYFMEMEGLDKYFNDNNIESDYIKPYDKYIRGSSGIVEKVSDEAFDHKIKVGYTFLNNRFGVNLKYDDWKYILENYSNKLSIVFDDHKVDGMPVTKITYEIEELLNNGSFATEDRYDLWKECHVKAGVKPVAIATWDNIFIANNNENFEKANLLHINDGTYVGVKVADIVSVYEDLFDIILYVSLVIIVVLTAYVAYDAAKRQSYNIGVLKSLGVRNNEIYTLFGIHEIEFIILSIILIFAFESYFISLANDVLINAIKNIYSGVVPNVDLFGFTYTIFMISILIVLISSVLSYLFSLLKIRSYEPINILKSKY